MTADRVYVVDTLRRLVGLRLDSGSRVASIPLSDHDLVLQNDQSDRIYIGSTRGVLQCLRELGNKNPSFHASLTEDEAAKPAPGGQDPFKAPADAGGQADPFKPADKGADPFKPKAGGAQDPFGGGGAKKPPDDPFGGNKEAGDKKDPFGGK